MAAPEAKFILCLSTTPVTADGAPAEPELVEGSEFEVTPAEAIVRPFNAPCSPHSTLTLSLPPLLLPVPPPSAWAA